MLQTQYDVFFFSHFVEHFMKQMVNLLLVHCLYYNQWGILKNALERKLHPVFLCTIFSSS